MKLVKMIGLAATMAATTMAFVGTSLTFANTESIVLCTQPELLCEESDWAGNFEEHQAAITLLATNPELKTSSGTIICKKSSLLISLLNLLLSSIISHVLDFLNNECNLGKTKCEATTEELGALLFKHGSKSLEASVEAALLEGRDTLMRMHCGNLINCIYSFVGPIFTMISPSGVLILTAKEAALTKTSGSLCPNESKWTATYTDTMESGLYIES